MIDTKELMRGNLMIVGKGTDWEQVCVIDEIMYNVVSLYGREFTTFATSLDPIPITEDLLLKNGFNKELLIEGMENYDDWVSYKKQVNGYFLDIRHCSNSIERDWYVHIDNDAPCCLLGTARWHLHLWQNVATYELWLGSNFECIEAPCKSA